MHTDRIVLFLLISICTSLSAAKLNQIADAQQVPSHDDSDSGNLKTSASQRQPTSVSDLGSEKSDAFDNLNQTGIMEFNDRRYKDALYSFEKVFSRSGQIQDLKMEATALNEIAMCYDAMGQKQDALESLKIASVKWRQIGDRDNEASTLGKIGDLFRTWGFPDRSLHQYAMAISRLSRSGDLSIRAAIENNSGLADLDLHRTKQALRYFNQALDSYQFLKDMRGQALALINIGAAYNQGKEITRAIDALNRSLEIAGATGDKTLEAASLNGLGQAYANLGDRNRALLSFDSALNAYREIGDLRGTNDVLKCMKMLDPIHHED